MSTEARYLAKSASRLRLCVLLGVLMACGVTYLSLPRSWFEIPDERLSNAAGPATFSGGSGSRPADFGALRDAAQRTPLDYAAHVRYGMALGAAGKMRAAEVEFLAARRLAPEAQVVHHNLGVLYLNAGRLDRADQAFSRELELAPGDGLAHYFRGLVFQKKRDSGRALAQFRLATVLAPTLPDAFLALAIEATRTETEAQVRGYVDRFIALTGNRGLASYVLSGAYRTWHRYPEAARFAEMSVAAEPSNYGYWHNLGQIYSYAKRGPDAQRALLKALGLARDPTTVLIELGMNAQAAGQFTNAAAYFRQALAASPNTGNIHLYLARVYQRMGDQATAASEERAFRGWERARDEARAAQLPTNRDSRRSDAEY